MDEGEYLDQLFQRSVFIMRDAKAKYKQLGLMWAGGKDSTLRLYIATSAFLNELPKILFLDTTFAFRETKDFIRNVSNLWNFKVEYCQNREALTKGVSPFTHSYMECCTKLKTDALNQCIKKLQLDGIMFGIRWDEHAVRGKESYYSIRDVPNHMRIHPILHWTEKDVWRAIKKYNVPVNPLYERIEEGNKRYYSLGCYPCTKPLSQEEHKNLGERGGRSLDKERSMERLRALGYM